MKKHIEKNIYMQIIQAQSGIIHKKDIYVYRRYIMKEKHYKRETLQKKHIIKRIYYKKNIS